MPAKKAKEAKERLASDVALTRARVRHRRGSLAQEQVAVENAKKTFQRNEARERRRQRRTRSLEDLQEELAAPTRTPEQQASDKDEILLLLSKLRRSEQKAMLLSVIEDLTYQDVGAELGIPAETVRTLLRRARHRLRDVPSQ